MADIQDQVYNLRAEVLEIKDVLADFDGDIRNTNTTINQVYNDLSKTIESGLDECVTLDMLKDYYTKNEVDGKLNELNFTTLSDIDEYMSENEYVKSDVLKSYVNMSSLEKFIDLKLNDYLTSQTIGLTYATKSELDNMSKSLNVDLTPYVKLNYLNENFYTKPQVDSLIPNTSIFVKKSELLTLLPLNDYALEDWVERTFIKKGDISLKGYVTEDMLKSSLSKYDNNVSTSTLSTKLQDYVTKTVLDNKLSDLSNGVYNYIPEKINIIIEQKGFISKSEANNTYVTNDSLRNLLDGGLLDMDTSVLDNFVKKTDIDDYKFVNEDELKSKLGELENNVTETIIPNALSDFAEKQDFISKTDVKNTYATKDEVRKYLINNPSSGNVDVDLTNFIKKSDMINYVKLKSYNEGLDKVISDVKKSYIPSALSTFKIENDLTSKSYVDSKFVFKNDFINNIETLNENLSSIKSDLSKYVKLSDLSEYPSKSDMSGYVSVSTYNSNISSINTNISLVKKQFDNYLKTSDSYNFVRSEVLDSYLDEYVTKDNLASEIAKISGSNNSDLDMSKYLTVSDYETLKKYVSKSLEPYSKRVDTYERKYIDGTFMTIDDVESNYYTSENIDEKFLTKSDAAGTYISQFDAHAQFLSKEDYRGIKDAMTLNAAYNNAENLFNDLLDNSRIFDGFYLIKDQVVVVKNNVPFYTQMTGSPVLTRNEAENSYVSKDEFDKNKAKNWIIDTGGNY